MPKKTTILIIILAIITGILIFLAVRSDKEQGLIDNSASNPTSTTNAEKIVPYATLAFSEPILDLSKNSVATQSVDITIDTSNKPVFGAQIELSYDPKVLFNVKVAPPTQNPFFGANPVILINSVDSTQGRISYAVGLSANDTGVQGKGVIATITFTANKFAGVPKSQIAFLPKTAVTSLKTSGSVLKNTSDLPIILTSQNASSSGY